MNRCIEAYESGSVISTVSLSKGNVKNIELKHVLLSILLTVRFRIPLKNDSSK